MKFAIAISLLTATAAHAAPGNMNFRRSQSVQIRNFASNVSATISMADLQLSLFDPNRSIYTDCSVAWNTDRHIAPSPEDSCTNDKYQISFPDGIDDVQKFTLKVAIVDGAESGQAVIDSTVAESDWVCKSNPWNGVKEGCEWVGVLNIAV